DLDSLDLLQFSINIEERIGVEIDADDIPAAISLADLADMIVAQRDK
ncbi:MAG: acyl carrier protein, partial [Rhizobiaceae bacterium]